VGTSPFRGHSGTELGKTFNVAETANSPIFHLFGIASSAACKLALPHKPEVPESTERSASIRTSTRAFFAFTTTLTLPVWKVIVYVDCIDFMPLLASTPSPNTMSKGAPFGAKSPLHIVDEQSTFPFQIGMAPLLGRPPGITSVPFNNGPPMATPDVNAGCPGLVLQKRPCTIRSLEFTNQ